jgi:ketosteroid isomerase-like protein
MSRISEHEERAAAERAGEPRSGEPPGQRILRMSPAGLVGSSIEAVLRRRMEELAQAIRDKDLERLMPLYASDVVAFELRPPLDARGVNVYRQNFEHWFAAFEGPLGFELHNLRVVPGDAAAFCHYLALVTGMRANGRFSGYWVRGTTCFERRDGEWLVTHEHVSMPVKS